MNAKATLSMLTSIAVVTSVACTGTSSYGKYSFDGFNGINIGEKFAETPYLKSSRNPQRYEYVERFPNIYGYVIPDSFDIDHARYKNLEIQVNDSGIITQIVLDMPISVRNSEISLQFDEVQRFCKRNASQVKEWNGNTRFYSDERDKGFTFIKGKRFCEVEVNPRGSVRTISWGYLD